MSIPPYAKPRLSRAERAFRSAAFDPRPDALEHWQERYGTDGERRTAKRGKESNRRRGTAVESGFDGKGVSAVLRKEGYTVVRSHQSQGAADVIGLRARLDVEGPPVRAVQAKRLQAFKPSGLNDAVAHFLGLGRHWRGYLLADGMRESWLWVDGEQWVARAVLTPEGRLTVSGPRAEEVERSLREMLARGGPRTRRTSTKSLRERLEVDAGVNHDTEDAG